MMVLAHAGHWLVQLAYFLPVLVFLGWLVSRRSESVGARRRRTRPPGTATGPPARRESARGPVVLA